LHQLAVSVRADRPVATVRCVPELTDLLFTQAAGRVHFTVPTLRGYQIIEITERKP